MNKFLFCFCLIFCCTCGLPTVDPQNFPNPENDNTFARIIEISGDANAFHGLENNDGSFVICGQRNKDSFIMELNNDGEYEGKIRGDWSVIEPDDLARTIIHSQDGNYIITGTTRGAGFRKSYLIKLDEKFEIIEGPNLYGSSTLRVQSEDVIELPDGKLLIVGLQVNPDPNNYDFYVEKVNIDFTSRKRISIMESDVQIGYGIIKAHEPNEYLILGEGRKNGNPDYLVKKIDSDLNVIQAWKYDGSFGSKHDVTVSGIAHPNKQEYVFVGNAEGNDFDTGQGYIVKVDNNGNFIDQKFLSSGQAAMIEEVIVSKDGHYVMVGRKMNNQGNFDGWVLKLDKGTDGGALGDIIWEREFDTNTSQDEMINDIYETTDGGFFLPGFRYCRDPNRGTCPENIFVAKIDENGCVSGEGKEFLVSSNNCN